MARVQKTLGAEQAAGRESWLKRRRDSQAKLTGGDPVGLAELIRDSARREGALPARGATSQLSPGEGDLFVKARRVLPSAIALARGVETGGANARIQER